MRGRWTWLAILAIGALVAGGTAARSEAATCAPNDTNTFGVDPGCFDVRFTGPPTTTNESPDFTQAGGHPFAATVGLQFNAPLGIPDRHLNWPAESLKEMDVSLPEGFAADPLAVPACTLADLSDNVTLLTGPKCAAASQVGVANVVLNLFDGGGGFFGDELVEFEDLALYNVRPNAGSAARFAVSLFGATLVFEARPRPDNGMTMQMHDVSQGFSLMNADIEFWGVPADPRHTPERACPGEPLIAVGGPTCAAGVAPRPMLRLPTSCGAPPIATVEMASWEHPEKVVSTSVANHLSPGLFGDPSDPANYPLKRPGLDSSLWGPPQGLTGCGALPFHPALHADSTSDEAGAPTGLDVEIGYPQQGYKDPDAVSESDLGSATIDFPAGISVNPSMANGLQSCGAGQAHLDSQQPAQCPNASKLGTVAIATPLLRDELGGSVYLATPAERPVSGIPVYVVAEDETFSVKFEGEVDIDEESGRMRVVLDDSPQFPLESMALHFFGGDRAPFLNPPRCGDVAFVGRFKPASGSPAVDARGAYSVAAGRGRGPCPAAGGRPFAPTVRGGSSSSRAGASTHFVLTVERGDGEQELRSLDFTLPAGLTASLGDVRTCPQAAVAAADANGRSGAEEIASPSCDEASRIGRFDVTAGAGQHPLPLDTGNLYLGGRVDGAPYSVIAITPMLVGPLDFGVLALQLPLNLGQHDGRVRIHGELPASKRGLPLALRKLSLHLDRPGFLSNPTSCGKSEISAAFRGDEGAGATASAPFRLRHCGALRFRPTVSMEATGGPKAMRHGGNPGFSATIKMSRGANPRHVALVMPASEQLDPLHIGRVCSKQQADSERGCPPSTIYGHAVVRTPMLDKPLRGPVFLRASEHRFPDLVAVISGGVELELAGRMSFRAGRVQIVFDDVPDLPLSRLSLQVMGGKRGIFVNNRNLCAAPPFAQTRLVAQNGLARRVTTRLGLACR